MEMFELVLIMLALIGVSNVLNRFIPSVPVPVFQIALGTLFALLPLGLHMTLNTELFMVLFIAPLLYNDGKRTPREELWNLRSPILLLALGLVFVTVFAGGYFIHWLIPSIPLPAAFALAAILSPTDAVAVGALAGRISLPKGILRLLEGESLMNDASGLVAFKFAVAAMVTGVFSLTQATLSFIWIALGGLICGAIVSFLIVWLRIFIRRLGMEDVTIHMLLQILTPFVIFLVTEHLGLSGILGVVAGGIVHAIERDHTESSQAELRVVSHNTWSVILYILNGLVFVILGLQIPNATTTIFQSPDYSNLQVIGFIGIISVGLILLRFIWVYVFWEGSWLMGSGQQMGKPKLTSSVLLSLSGVRGAVTLAAAFSIPYVLQDGSPFPERDLIIFLAAGVILFSLVIASIVLPILSKSPESEKKGDLEEKARIKIIQAGINAVREATNDENRMAAGFVIAEYKRELTKLQNGSGEKWSDTKQNRLELKIRYAGIQAERQEIQNMLSNGDISGELAVQVQEIIDQMEQVMSSRSKMQMAVTLLRVRRMFSKRAITKPKKQGKMDDFEQLRKVRIQTSKAAIAAIHELINDKNREAAQSVIAKYNESIERMQTSFGKFESEDVFNQRKNELKIKAIQAERNEVQALFESGEINWTVAGKMRQYINYLEAGILEPGEEE
ncbi:Na+/H+ antiporter [Paenibacillus segetis]|uniref:Sodium, potassium, lithium and rubidium/H(+) antiporter n=1 Tax=Paenibacillus segetis TaxID=1325360 RepID=A0ABQ1YQF1_9BACL|nr:Na+/H+ antiporter [Paenibacillus segetis]GGH32675.1 sodium, potassium, lithium and rubidium/H(+) antiporter [Paenibacillus segetis]